MSRNDPRRYSMDGRSQSLSEWCVEFGADYNRTYLRLQDGWSLAAALSEPKREGNGRVPRRYSYGGERRTLEEWAKLFGIDTRRVRLRMRNGWPFEVALTTPIQHPNAPRVRRRQSALTITPGVVADFAENGRDRRGSVARDRG